MKDTLFSKFDEMMIGIEREIHILIKEKFLYYIMIFVKNEEGLISNLRCFLFLEFLKM